MSNKAGTNAGNNVSSKAGSKVISNSKAGTKCMALRCDSMGSEMVMALIETSCMSKSWLKMVRVCLME